MRNILEEIGVYKYTLKRSEHEDGNVARINLTTEELERWNRGITT